jgi:hypothetical protein
MTQRDLPARIDAARGCIDSRQSRSALDNALARMISAADLRSPAHALPFWLSLALVPLVFVAAALGGWWFLLIPAVSWWLLGALDI